MKVNIKALCISLTVILTLLIMIISIWSRTSTQFGREFMELYNSVHPHPFRAASDLKTLEHAYGVGLDMFYALVDSLIFALGFGLLYNWIAARSQPEQENKQ